MFDKIVGLIEEPLNSLLEGLSKREKGIFVLLLVIILCVSAIYFETQTRIIYLTSIEKKAGILKDLKEFAKDDSNLRVMLNPLFEEVVDDLNKGKVTPMELPTLSYLLSLLPPTVILKFISGASLGLLFFFAAIFSKRPEKRKVVRGAIAVASFFGLIGAFLPILGYLWVNFILLFIIQVALLSFAGRKPSSHVNTVAG